MIMPRGQQLLLPANPLFVFFSLLVALLLDMVQNIALFGNANWAPEIMAVVLVFWGISLPIWIADGCASVIHAWTACACLYSARFHGGPYS